MVLSRSIGLKAAVVLAIATTVPFSNAIPAIAASIGDWNYSPQTGALEFGLGQHAGSAGQPKYFLMANPMRIVVDLPGVAQDVQALEARAGGVFTQISAAETESGQTRLVLQLAPGTVLQPGQVELTALADGRWSLRPLLAEGQVFSESSGSAAIETVAEPEATAASESAREVTVSSANSNEFNEFMDGPLEVVVESPALALPTLEAREAKTEFEIGTESPPTEFVSMEDTLELQQAIAAAPRPDRLVEDSMGGVASHDIASHSAHDSIGGEVAWGSSQLPPVPTNIAAGSVTSGASAEIAPGSTLLPQLPQPQLGQAPFVFQAPEQSALVDPAQIVDVDKLNLSPGISPSPRPPAEVKPVMDPKVLSLDQQSAAALGGQTGLILTPAAGTVVQPAISGSAISGGDLVEQESTQTDESVPFLVEFGAPLPGVIPNTDSL